MRPLAGYTGDKYRLTMDSLDIVNFYPHISWQHAATFVTAGRDASPDFVRRLCRSYKHQLGVFEGFGESFWGSFADKNKQVHEALLRSDIDAAAAIVRNPSSTDLFYGFDSSGAELIDLFRSNPGQVQGTINSVCDRLLRSSEAIGARRMLYPEAALDANPPDVDQLLTDIEAKLGISLTFPNVFPDEFGVETSKGVISYRAVQALYQAWRIRQITDKSVVEIGAGLGRTAYYARAFGLRDYTIIDIPLTTIAQAAFLSNALGENAITLPGETAQHGCIRIETPSWFYGTSERFALAANIDSMVEMDRSHAERYADKISRHCDAFWSVNHEYNPFVVSDLKALNHPYHRSPYWLRKGYAEHLYKFTTSASSRP